ncbi:MAG: acyl-CoA dehydrogenase C-terminal domain-containing protein [Hyphomicrobiales bacterium]|nr:acyl-CoA dehydrogenase C-terminal domain-containing protein [Hyphomicrobiales bacterium]
MPTYTAPIRDFQFALKEWLEIGQYQGNVPGFDDLDILDPILDEGARFCQEVLFPLNQVGDAEGLKYENGNVTLPTGFKDAYRQYVESGWASFACDAEFGGQNLPNVLNTPLIEMICSSNLSFGLIPGLTHGAYSALHLFGTQEQKQTYLPKMISGEWTGVMCLTEPQAGTDLGLITTKAVPNRDGSYAITGTKIFISCGEHDAVDNIVHLILARLPDAPKGVKGISLFVASKYLVNTDGSLGERNAIQCGSIEHKMGIHASPTCVMNYEGAKAWLVGEPHKGLRAMFTMMNEARLLVGIQGLGIGEIAYQNALAYAKERLQGRALRGALLPNKPADPITAHPDVRRMLLTQRAFAEGGRILALWMALHVDLAHRHPDETVRREADEFVQLLTPVTKAYLTSGGTETASIGMQVLGGYGFIREYGMEQYLRDCRITEIYEGTNGVQALDLVGRKLPMHTGRLLRRFFHPVSQFIEENRDVPEMAEFTKPLYQAFRSLQQASLWVAQKGLANPDEAAGASVDYLNLFAHVTLGYIWARTAKIALAKQEGDEKAFYQRKLATARFYMHKLLPRHYSLLATLTSGVKHLELAETD